MTKKGPILKKNVQNHTIEATTLDHHSEVAKEFFPPLLDSEGTLADCYLLKLKEEFKRSGHH